MDTERRPRQWADLILRDQAKLDDVPPHIRKWVRGYLEDVVERGKTTDATRIKHYSLWISVLDSREARNAALAKVPEHLRERVRETVLEKWRASCTPQT